MPDSIKNPFGPAVGNIMSKFECSINGGVGECFISSQAVIISQNQFFGFQVNRVIIPWREVKSLSRNNNTIIVGTKSDSSYAFDGVDRVEETLKLLRSAFLDQPMNEFGHLDALRLCNQIVLLPTNEDESSLNKDSSKRLLRISGGEIPSQTNFTLKKLQDENKSIFTEIVSKVCFIDF